MQKGKAIAEQRTPVAEQQLGMVPMIAGPTLVSKEEQTEEENRRKSKTTEIIRAFSQLCICSGRILSCCSDSLHRIRSEHCKAATSRSPCNKAVS